MNYKSCLTCEYFNEAHSLKFKELIDSFLVEILEATCLHELSENSTVEYMLTEGQCTRKRKLWKQKEIVPIVITE